MDETEASVGRARKYRDLIAWQKAMALVEQVYSVSTSWPNDERYGLTNQARRAAVSIPANIAEGHGRTGNKELAHHLSIAQGSLAELETLLLIAHRLDYLAALDCDALLARSTETSRVIGGLIRSLRATAI